MKKAINTRVLMVLAMTCLFLFSACHKLPECENPLPATIIYYGDICDTCADDETVYIHIDGEQDTMYVSNTIQKIFIKNGLRVEVEWKPSYRGHYGPINYPANWCGPKYPAWIEIICIQVQ
jgi:hypothetical protein